MITEEGRLYDIECDKESAALMLLPVPWEATTSYGAGASRGPELIFNASAQLDFFDFDFTDVYKKGFYWLGVDENILAKSRKAKALCQSWVFDENPSPESVTQANALCQEMVDWVYSQSKNILAQNKLAAVVGGDHSTPFGLIRALGEKYKNDYSILHIDAHADLRTAYQDFTYSHASIFYNVMQAPFAPKKLVQIGIRDFCQEERDYIDANSKRIRTFFDYEIKSALAEGSTWQQMAQKIINEFSDNVYISFDIDGLSPEFCPNTGTPVPGGLSFDQMNYMFKLLKQSGKRIIGFDLNEVSPGAEEKLENEWDGNIGMRMLYKLCCLCVASQK